MTAILISDTDLNRLADAVNAARAAGGIPNGGLMFWKGQYFQLVVDGSSSVEYTIVARQGDDDFAADAQALTAGGAFALGAPLRLDVGFVQAFGDMAGAGSGGGGGTIFTTSDDFGGTLATIDTTSLGGGFVIVDVTDQPTAGMLFVDGGVPIMQLIMSGGTLTLSGDSTIGSINMGPTATLVQGPGALGAMGAMEVNTTGLSLRHPAYSSPIVETIGTDAATGVLNLRRPFQATAIITADATNTLLRSPDNTMPRIRVNSSSVLLQCATRSYTVSDAQINPSVTAVSNLGTGGLRFNGIFLSTAPDVSSDADHKTAPEAIPDAVLDAVGDVDLVQFKLLAAVELKGEEKARLHTGVIAQQLKAAFEARGLDATKYGLLCYDEWDARPEEWSPAVLDEEGNEVAPPELLVPAMDAGSMWSVRYEELLILEAARVRRELSKLSSK